MEGPPNEAQIIMGHGDVDTNMNTYNKLNAAMPDLQRAISEMDVMTTVNMMNNDNPRYLHMTRGLYHSPFKYTRAAEFHVYEGLIEKYLKVVDNHLGMSQKAFTGVVTFCILDIAIDFGKCDFIKGVLQDDWCLSRLNGELVNRVIYKIYSRHRCHLCVKLLLDLNLNIVVSMRNKDLLKDFFVRDWVPSETDSEKHFVLSTIFRRNVNLNDQHFKSYTMLSSNVWRNCYKTASLLIQHMGVPGTEADKEYLFTLFSSHGHWGLYGMMYCSGHLATPCVHMEEILDDNTGAVKVNKWIHYCTGYRLTKQKLSLCITAMHSQPRSLLNLCVISIRECLQRNIIYNVKELPITELQKDMITMNHPIKKLGLN